MVGNIGRSIDLKIHVGDILDIEQVEDVLVPHDLANSVLDFGVVEEKYWYYGERGAAAYLSLNKSSKTYQVFQKSLLLLQSKTHHILDLAFEQFAKMTTPTAGGGGVQQNRAPRFHQ